jgi:hypothetical protein
VAITKPVVPSAMRPRKRLTIFAENLRGDQSDGEPSSPEGRWNQPTAAAESVAPSKRKGIPMIQPNGASPR